ncbi:hypothetical protein NKH77_25035 [Streptomyces sp. M19]
MKTTHCHSYFLLKKSLQLRMLSRAVLGRRSCAPPAAGALQKLREGYQAAGLIGGPLELWLGFDKYGKQAFQTRTGNDPSDLARSIAENVKSGDNAFAVIFQRGILLSAVRFDIARSDFSGEWECSSDRFAVLDRWIERMNARVAPYLANPDFWLGTGIKGDRNVNYTKVGANGVKGLVSLRPCARLPS